jgi:glyoxylase-like metal-dependent hydrolase (beta-lactamase superfamily II)
MATRTALLAGLLLALVGAHLHAQGFGTSPAQLALVKLADDLFVIHNEFVPGNTTVLITAEGLVLVDDKYEVDHAGLMTHLRRLSKAPIRYIINTHHHADHSGGNARLQQLGARVVSSERARARMVSGGQPGAPELTFDTRLHLRLGGKAVDLHYVGRGHTDGDIVALFPQHRVLAAGDLFAYGDRTPELIDYAGGGSAREWTATLDRALTLPFDRVVPGHGVVTTRGEMQKFRDSTAALYTRVRTLVTQKQSRAAIEKMLRTEFRWADLHVQAGLDGVIAEAR